MANQIYILFNFKEESDEGENLRGRYKILMSHDQYGEINLQDDIKEREFDTKEHMLEFIQDFVDESTYEQVCLITASDFNIGIESCHSAEEFQDLFITHGSIVQRRSGKSKKSLFSKLF